MREKDVCYSTSGKETILFSEYEVDNREFNEEDFKEVLENVYGVNINDFGTTSKVNKFIEEMINIKTKIADSNISNYNIDKAVEEALKT